MARKLSGINPFSYLGVEAATPPQFVKIDRAPTANDYINFNVGTIWLDTSGLKLSPPVNPTNEDVYILVSKNSKTAAWVNFGGGNVDTLTGDTGGAISPDAMENITIAGGKNIGTVGTTNTITINLDDVVNLPNTVDGGEFQFGGTLFMHNYGTNNTFLGASSGNKTLTTASENVGIGLNSLSSLTLGGSNTAIGNNSLRDNTTGNTNIAVGRSALILNTTGLNNIAIGQLALGTATTQSDNTAIGVSALLSSTGSNNTALGSEALKNSSSPSGLTAVGRESLRDNTTGANNTAVGYNSIATVTTGSNNTALGYNVLNNSGVALNNNTALGSQVLAGALTGGGNTGVGSFALNAATSGSGNTSVGRSSCLDLTTGAGNSALGTFALNALTTGDHNTTLGESSLLALTSGDRNIAVGYQPAVSLSSGSFNVIVGSNSAGGNYTGSESSNILIQNSGTLGDNNIIRLGDSGSGDYQQNKCFIAGVRGITTDNADAIAVLVDSAGQFGTVSSSMRFKQNIEDMDDQSRIIHKLRPVTFNYRKHPQVPAWGLIAEEVEKVFPQLVVYDKEDLPETVKYNDLIPLLLNEIQVLKKRVDELESKQREE